MRFPWPGCLNSRKTLLLLALSLAVVLTAIGSGYVYWRVTRFDSLILLTARQYRVDASLVKAIVHEESWFDPNSRGENGEIGLMQISPGAAREYVNYRRDKTGFPPDLFNPRMNLQVGCWYLRQSIDLFKEFPDPIPLAIARYNAGESRVRQWVRTMENRVSGLSSSATRESAFLQCIQIPSTRDYVRRVLRRYRNQTLSPF